MGGYRGAVEPERTLVLHYDGRFLKLVRTPNPYRKRNQVYGLTTVGREVWAVGSGVTRTEPVTRYVPFVLRYDGQRWRTMSPPVPAPNNGNGAELYDISGTSAHDIWAVGIVDVNDE